MYSFAPQNLHPFTACLESLPPTVDRKVSSLSRKFPQTTNWMPLGIPAPPKPQLLGLITSVSVSRSWWSTVRPDNPMDVRRPIPG